VRTILSEPIAVTFDGNTQSLPRTSIGKKGTVYRTADGELELIISSFLQPRDGTTRRVISLSRAIPDPTPSDVFDDFRILRNTFGISYSFDTKSRANASVDLPLLRASLLSLVDGGLAARIIQGES
jgi:hypothetical protein